MPIYEYECSACGNRVEKLQKLSDPLLTDCPACGAAQLRKLISRAGFQLKGTGWYVTDFKDKPKAKKPAAEAASDSKSEANSETKAESAKQPPSAEKPATTASEKTE
jgi:putative FmdB family regulatory protein